MQNGTVNLSNGEEYYFVEQNTDCQGKEPSVLFVHGNTAGALAWKDTMNHIKDFKRHQVAVDLRGMGKSSYKSPTTRYGHWAEDLKDFCKKKGIEKCAVVGWSLGGGIAMKLAEIAPELVVKVILVASMPHNSVELLNGEKKCFTAAEIKQIPEIAHMNGLIETKNWEQIGKMFTEFFLKDLNFSKEDIEEIAKLATMQRNYCEAVQAVGNSDIDISKVKAEGLVIHGGADFIAQPDKVKPTGEYFKNWVLLENRGHCLPSECPKEFEDLITKFIAK